MATPDGGSGGGDKGKFNKSLKLHAQQKLELGFAYSGSKSYRSLIRKMKNVGLKSKQKEAEQGGSESDSTSLPLRPHAEDCSYYMRTGYCRYGPKCKYNHPLTRPIPNVDDEDAGTEKGSDGNSEKSSVACKFYLAAGGCKNGESCNYLHSKPESEMAILKLNFMGLPIRVGEKECPFYMRTGLCAYGSDCRFHHPDPTVVDVSDPCDSNQNAEAERYFSSTAGYIGEEPFSQHFSGSSSYQAPWPSSMITNKGGPYMDNYASYMPATSLYPEGFYQTTEWSGYQVLQYSQEKKPPRSVSTGNAEMDRADLSKKVAESPESPTEPKSRVAPPRPKREPCVLNELGLPLRPGKEVCWHHANYGLCRNGRVCAFDHPMDKRSKNLPNMSKCGTKEVTPDPDDESWNSWN